MHGRRAHRLRAPPRRFSHPRANRRAVPYVERRSRMLRDALSIERLGDLLCTVIFMALLGAASSWAAGALQLADAGALLCGFSPFSSKSYGVNAEAPPHEDDDEGMTVLTWFTLGATPPGNEFVLTTANCYMRPKSGAVVLFDARLTHGTRAVDAGWDARLGVRIGSAMQLKRRWLTVVSNLLGALGVPASVLAALSEAREALARTAPAGLLGRLRDAYRLTLRASHLAPVVPFADFEAMRAFAVGEGVDHLLAAAGQAL